jgi:hypothetical protein
MSEKRRGGRTYSIRNIERMSVKYQWVERAEAWDLYLDRYRQLAVQIQPAMIHGTTSSNSAFFQKLIHFQVSSAFRGRLRRVVLERLLLVADYTATASGSFTSNKPRVWSGRPVRTPEGGGLMYTLAPDGKHIAMFPAETPAEDKGPAQVTFLLRSWSSPEAPCVRLARS